MKSLSQYSETQRHLKIACLMREKRRRVVRDELYGCASRFAQTAYQCSDIISDTLADWDAQDDDDRCIYNHDTGRAYRESHAACRTALQNANTLLAGARAKLKYWLQK